MKYFRSLILSIGMLCILGAPSFAQEAAEDTVFGWKKEIIGTLNLTQASFNNWAQGGENTLAWQINFNSNFTLDIEKWNWANTGKFAMGFAKIEGEEARKSADELNLESVLTRKIGKFLSPFIAATAKTQFVSGFEYGDSTKTKISGFIDPGYFTQSAGVGYYPNDNFKTRIGLMVKETVTDIFLEKSKTEAGFASVTDFKRKFSENVLFISKLNLFSNLKAFDQIDLLWENDLTLKVSKYINVSVEVDWLYDKDISTNQQIRQTLAVGFTYTFL